MQRIDADRVSAMLELCGDGDTLIGRVDGLVLQRVAIRRDAALAQPTNTTRRHPSHGLAADAGRAAQAGAAHVDLTAPAGTTPAGVAHPDRTPPTDGVAAAAAVPQDMPAHAGARTTLGGHDAAAPDGLAWARWERRELPGVHQPRTTGRWLVVGASALAERIASALRAAGAEVLREPLEGATSRNAAGADGQRPEHAKQLEPLEGAVHVVAASGGSDRSTQRPRPHSSPRSKVSRHACGSSPRGARRLPAIPTSAKPASPRRQRGGWAG